MLQTQTLPGGEWARTLVGAVRLIRPTNLVILMLAVMLGALLAAGPSVFAAGQLHALLLAAVSAALIAAAGNAINDVHDLAADRVNRPSRPLPSGVLTPAAARTIWAACSALGILLALTLSFAHVVLAAACAAMLWVYSRSFQRTVLAGNVVVSLATAAALVYGALLEGLPAPVFAGAGFAFGSTLAREMVKDVEDVAGDRSEGVATLAVRYGDRTAALFAAAVLLLTVAATPLPFLFLTYGGIYLVAILVTDAILLRAVWILLSRPSQYPSRASHIIKWGMVAGILALALYWVD